MGFAEILNDLLKERGAAARLSAETGISERLIGAWRKNESQPTLGNILKLCKHYRMSSDELLGVEVTTTADGEQLVSPEKAELLEEMQDLDRVEAGKTKEFIRFLKSQRE